MCAHIKYVPILRIKNAELKALGDLNQQHIDKSSITPLLEILPRSFFRKEKETNNRIDIPPRRALSKIAKDICTTWGFNAPIYIDYLHIDNVINLKNSHPLTYLADYVRQWGVKLIPVTGLGITRSNKYQSAVQKMMNIDKRGVCVRVFVKEIFHEKFPEKLNLLLDILKALPHEVDLIVDYQLLDPHSIPSLINVCNHIPKLNEWRNFTIISGAFFEFPSEVEKFEVHEWPRNDWLFWKKQVTVQKEDLLRLPSYGDYTVQYPYHKELRDGYVSPSAHIRYACDDYWIIMRGDTIKNDGSKQYPAFASMLCERNEFSGKEFSCGDRYFYDKSQIILEDSNEGGGSPNTWLRAAINRHMTLVLHQLANLPDA